jgi:hypothetical protein
MGLAASEGVDWKHIIAAKSLLAFTFWRLQVMPLAQQYGVPLVWAVPVGSNQPGTPFGGRPFDDILKESGVAAFTSEGDLLSADSRRIEAYRCDEPGIQPWACVWFSADRFVGALTITDTAYGTGEKSSYALIYRDLDGPPITILELGATLPPTEPIHRFAAGFVSHPGEAGRPRPLRVQMEAAWFQQAGVSPLAAAWCDQGSAEYASLREVRERLDAANNADWNCGMRFHTLEEPKYEVAVYVSRRAVPARMVPYYGSAAAEDNLRLRVPLEHLYCVVAMPKDRRYVASYRLVSEPIGEADRLFRFERLQGGEISVLEVASVFPEWPLETMVKWIEEEPDQAGYRGLRFEAADTSDGPVRGEALRAFFPSDIVLADVQPGTEVEIKAMPAYTVPVSDNDHWRAVFVNQLRMTGEGSDGSFTLRFSQPLCGVSVERDLFQPRSLLHFSPSQFREPAWRMSAFDEAGRIVDWIGEGGYSTGDTRDGSLPLTQLAIRGRGIVSVRFDCNLASGSWDLRGNLGFSQMMEHEQAPPSEAAP